MSRRCLVTGGSRGLGRAICRALAARGDRVAFTWNTREDAASALAEELGALSFQGDVADKDHATATLKSIQEQWGGLDVLVNAAGVLQVLPIALLEEEDWDRTMAVNVKGAYLFSRAALRLMIRAKSGRILNIGNFGIDRVVDTPVHYAASKGALLAFSSALAREVGRYGITVNVLSPGLLDEGLGVQLPQHRVDQFRHQSAMGRTGTVEELAATAVLMLEDEFAMTTAGHLVVDGGL